MSGKGFKLAQFGIGNFSAACRTESRVNHGTRGKNEIRKENHEGEHTVLVRSEELSKTTTCISALCATLGKTARGVKTGRRSKEGGGRSEG